MRRYPDYDEARQHDSEERDAGREDHGKGIPLSANPWRGGMHTIEAALWEDGWLAADEDANDVAEEDQQ